MAKSPLPFGCGLVVSLPALSGLAQGPQSSAQRQARTSQAFHQVHDHLQAAAPAGRLPVGGDYPG